MKLSVTTKHFLMLLTGIMLTAGIVVYVAIRQFFPAHYFGWYPAIPAFFYAFGWYSIFTFEHCRRTNVRKMLSVYIGMKVVKMLISMVIIFFYLLFVRIHKTDFTITFFLFYLFSILYETLYFYWYEHNKMKNKNK